MTSKFLPPSTTNPGTPVYVWSVSDPVSSAVLHFITLPSFACGVSLTSAFPLQELACGTS